MTDRRITEGSTARRQLSLVDSHVHLDRYTNEACAALLARAAAAGVRALLTVGVDLASSERGVELSRRYQTSHGVVAAVGLHPAFLPPEVASPQAPGERDVDFIAQLAATEPNYVVAIGEIGLDTVDGSAPLDLQAAVFRAQLRLARTRQLPVVLHVQGGEARLMGRRILAEEGGGAGVVVHYFTGTEEEAQAWLDLGCHLSVGRPVTKTAEIGVRAAIASPVVPLERLLVETDTYPLLGRRTEPTDVIGVVEAVAALKQVSVGEVARRIRLNFHRLFLPSAGDAFDPPYLIG